MILGPSGPGEIARTRDDARANGAPQVHDTARDQALMLLQSIEAMASSPSPKALLLVCPPVEVLTDEVRTVWREIGVACEQSGTEIWSAGWSGTPAALLTSDELHWEYSWSVTSHWKNGITQLTGRPVAAFSPAWIEPVQAEHLSLSVPVVVRNEPERIRIWNAGSWHTGVTLSLREGRTQVPRTPIPTVLAALQHARSRRGVPRDRIRRTLLQQDEGRPSRTKEPEGEARELQGGFTGTFELGERDLRIRFPGGRVGVITHSDTATPAIRAQGYVQLMRDRKSQKAHTGRVARWFSLKTSTHPLESAFAAWFTGNRIRGTQERATIDPWFDVETTAIATDDVSELLLNWTVRQLEPLPTAGIVRASLYEIPLMKWSAGDALTVRMTGGTSFPTTVSGDELGAGVMTVAGEAVHVPCFGAGSGVWISATDPRGPLHVPFVFSGAPIDVGSEKQNTVLCFNPLGRLENGLTLPAEWSVSFRFVAGRADTAPAPVDTRILREAAGFHARARV